MPLKTMSSAQPTHPPLGTLIDAGALELVEVLGVGGYGVVYRAVDSHTSHTSRPRSYAVKCLMQTQAQSNRQRQLHIREITLHQLASAHPNVVTLHRVIEESNYTYIIMDYASDGDLFSQILHCCRYLGDDFLIKHVFLQLLDAVEYCHSLGIYHRDLKPENVLCFDAGLRIAITDFGLATTDKFSEEFRTGSVYHMSPECQGGIFAPTGSYSPMANDIWSLAIILLNLATGRNPWKSASASDPTFQAYLRDPMGFLPTVLPISSEINDILVRMLEVDWRDRMTLPELREAIEQVDSFYSDGVVFEGSMARCPWEAGMDIDSASSNKESVPQHPSTSSDLKSRWSNDSLGDSRDMFTSPAREEISSYGGRWSDYDDSPISSRGINNLNLYDAPRTPPSTHSSISSTGSLSNSGSLPATPNAIDMTFGAKMDVNPKVLHINTEQCDPRFYNDQMTSSYSTNSSMMQTAIEYDPYSSSFFLASPAIKSLAIASPNAERGGKQQQQIVEERDRDREMDDMISSWNYSATDLSLRSSYSRDVQSSNTSRIDCDVDELSGSPDADVWPEYNNYHHHQQQQSIPAPQPRYAFLDFPPFTASSNSRPMMHHHHSSASTTTTKKSETRSIRGSSLFRFFPRSPPSTSSSTRQQQGYAAESSSRTPSPMPSIWTSPRGAGVVLNSQDGLGWRRRQRAATTTSAKGPARHWFSPGKLFSGIGA